MYHEHPGHRDSSPDRHTTSSPAAARTANVERAPTVKPPQGPAAARTGAARTAVARFIAGTIAVPLAVQSARLEVPQLEVTALRAWTVVGGVLQLDLVGTAVRALVGATRRSIDQNTRHIVRSVFVHSPVACGAACGVSGTHKIAQIGMSQMTDLS